MNVQKPQTGEIRYTTFDNVIGKLPNPDTILRNAGISQDVYIEMLDDPQIFTVYQKRKRSIQRLKWQIEADNTNLQDEITQIFENLNFTLAKSGLLKAIPLGYSVAEIIWEEKEGKFTPTDIKPRKTTKFAFNSHNELIYYTDNGENLAPYGKFIVHVNDQDDANNRYGTALNSKCYWYWRFKKEGWRVWSLFLDKYGTPPQVLKTGQTNETKINDYLTKLDNVANGSNIVIGLDEEISSLNIGGGKVSHETYISEADRQIAKVYTGSTLLVEEGKNGNYNTAGVMQDSFSDIVFTDAEALADSIRECLIRPYMLFNYGKTDTIPKLVFYSDEDETTQGLEETKDEDEEKPSYSIDFSLDNKEDYSLPKDKGYIEKLNDLLALRVHKSYKKTISIDNMDEDSTKAYFELKDKLDVAFNDEMQTISHALFISYLYAKSRFKDKKFLDKFTRGLENPVIVDFEKAREIFKKKAPISNAEFKKLTTQAKSQAFSIAHINSLKQINMLKHSLEESIGIGEKAWAKKAREILGDDVLSKAHLTNIYRTNMYSAYNKAHYEEYQEKYKDDFPYMMYDAVGDGRTRPAHLALDGKVFKHNDSIWNTIYPPNGFNCRCTVRFLTKDSADDIGISKGKDFKTPKYAPDKGWAYHCGKSKEDTRLQTYSNDGRNSFDWQDFKLTKTLPLVTLAVALTKTKIETPTHLSDSIGGQIYIPQGTYQLELIEDILANPTEIWMYSKVTTANRLAYILRYIKKVKIGSKIYYKLVEVDNLGNFISIQDIKNPNKYRKGYLIQGISDE